MRAKFWRCEAGTLLQSGHLWIEDGPLRHVGDPGEFFVVNPRNGCYYSKFGIANQ
jgi:hypothetical protein